METLETRIGRHVAHERERLGLSVRDLAARMEEVGHKILPSGITKIERGQRGVSVTDLLALARALRVAPLLLLFPVGKVDRVEVLPGDDMATWDAAKWFNGEAYPAEDVATHWAVPLYLFRQHDRHLAEYVALLTDQQAGDE